MATLLARCELLICANTGAAHLAAAAGTTVLGLYGASAWFAETAPYGNDDVVLQTPLNAPMSAISIDIANAAALNRLGRLSITDLRTELRSQNQSAWETSLQPASSHDPLGGMTYRPIHRDSFTPDELFAQSLRRAFAGEFLTHASPSRRTQLPSVDPQCPHVLLGQILNHMQTLAHECAESTRTRAASSEVGTASSALIAAMERLRELSDEPVWKRFRPVIHNLDWQLRMLPQQSPEATFRSYGQAYASADRILKNTNTNPATVAAQDRSAVQNNWIEMDGYWKGIKTRGREEGGQVPSSVRR
jgi:hypothetical protein